MVRAKFKCDSVKLTTWDREIEFTAVVSGVGNTENDEFFKTTPSGKLNIRIKNENINFEVGKEYYLDFTEVISTYPSLTNLSGDNQ